MARLSGREDSDLRHTDLRCSEIGFGTWALGSTWWGKVTSGEGANLLRRALELGVTFFDTGNVYGQGANEEIVAQRARGRAARERPDLDQVRLRPRRGAPASTRRASGPRTGRPSTCGHRSRRAWGGSAPTTSTSTSSTTRAWTRSSDDDLFEELERLRDEGKLRHYGIALGPAIGWRDEGLRAIAQRDGSRRVQTVYNVLEQEPGRDFLDGRRRARASA